MLIYIEILSALFDYKLLLPILFIFLLKSFIDQKKPIHFLGRFICKYYFLLLVVHNRVAIYTAHFSQLQISKTLKIKNS